MSSPSRSPPPVGPVSAPDLPDLRPDSPDISPTFRIAAGAYKCQGCGIYCGDVIDFQKERYKMDLPQARAALADRYNIAPGETPRNPPPRPSKPRPAAPVPTLAPLAPIPPAALACRPHAHPRHGAPSSTWEYRDPDGRPLAFVLRFDPAEGRKQFCPQTWTEPDGWRWAAPEAPRPLYGLDRLAARPAAPVCVCEGEKAADAAALLLPDCVTLASMNGSQAAGKTDFGPLARRRVRIWRDADPPGAAYAAKVAELARTAGAVSIEVLDLAALARNPTTDEPRELPKGWDAADALADGWTPETLPAAVRWVPAGTEAQAKKPAAAPPGGEALPHPFELTPGGIYYRRPSGAKGGGDDGPPLFVCPPLRVLAVTRDPTGNEFGRLVEFNDLDGEPRREVIGDRERQGSGDALRARLAALGFEIGTHPEARGLFLDLLRRWTPAARARSVTRTGWTDDGAFVLPDRVLGEGAEPVILTTEGALPAFGTRGPLDDWRQTVGRLCVGNSRLLFSVSMAFAPPLLRLTGGESGGFHLKGASTDASSSGKTTAQKVAVSVCGPPAFLERWRTTDNGLETTAETHNDAPLILDDLNDEITPQAAGATLYMLAGGTGKVRMDRSTGARPVKRWRLLFLSSGEFGIRELMATIQRKAKAGQEVRMVEVPADGGAGHGVFENLHNHSGGAAFSEALTDAAAMNYGTPFISFVNALIRNRETLPATIKRLRDQFVSRVLDGISSQSGQVPRVASRFGLVAVAGELATAEGITGWPEGAAFDAAERCFVDWLKARGGPVSAEERELLTQVRYFFEKHSNRFRWKDRALDNHAPEVALQAGFKDDPAEASGSIVFYCFPETFKAEVLIGYDSTDAAKVLLKRGLLVPDSDGRPTQKVRLPGYKNPVRVYVLTTDTLRRD